MTALLSGRPPLCNQGKIIVCPWVRLIYYNVGVAAEGKKERGVKTPEKRDKGREMERSQSSCSRMEIKEDETWERNDKTASVIAIDLSALCTTVSN